MIKGIGSRGEVFSVSMKSGLKNYAGLADAP